MKHISKGDLNTVRKLPDDSFSISLRPTKSVS